LNPLIMRQSVKDYLVKIISRFPLLEPIYEIGSYRVEGQEEFADLRPFFPGKVYVGCDMRPGLGVDRIEDVQCLKSRSNSVGTILIFDTLEHVENVHRAMEEIYRILKPGGMVIMSSVMNFPIHDYPSDYWRFTPEAFELLLKRFEVHEVEFDGGPAFPEGIYGFGIKRYRKGFLGSFVKRIKSLKKRFRYPLSEVSSTLFFLPPCAVLDRHAPFPILENPLALW
jgi:SAM-dependent methyltransferase